MKIYECSGHDVSEDCDGDYLSRWEVEEYLIVIKEKLKNSIEDFDASSPMNSYCMRERGIETVKKLFSKVTATISEIN